VRLSTERACGSAVARVAMSVSWTSAGVQSGDQIERNRGALRSVNRTESRRNAAYERGLVRLGAGRSQVQILSPRCEESPGNPGLSAFQGRAAFRVWGTTGGQFLQRPSTCAHETHVRNGQPPHQVGRLLRSLANARRPPSQSPARQGPHPRREGRAHPRAGRARGAPHHRRRERAADR
jgi:hypothetical protein